MAVDWGRVDRGSKPFFFEKKNQKTFAPRSTCVTPAVATSKKSKFFCFFLFTKRSACVLPLKQKKARTRGPGR
jgi:hypothetical protein